MLSGALESAGKVLVLTQCFLPSYVAFTGPVAVSALHQGLKLSERDSPFQVFDVFRFDGETDRLRMASEALDGFLNASQFGLEIETRNTPPNRQPPPCTRLGTRTMVGTPKYSTHLLLPPPIPRSLSRARREREKN